MKHFITLTCVILISCGGGGSVAAGSSPDSSSTPAGVSGLGGSISDIEIIDVD